MKRLIFVAAILFNHLFAMAQPASYAAYIKQYGDMAMSEQVRTGIPAAIKMAQGLLESGAGKGSLVMRSNNHFGIKCKSDWTGAKAYHDDDAKGECFRAYDAPEQSYKDHSDYLRTSSRYAFLFDYDITDYKAWANGLKKAGYATNPRYPQLLIKVIEENNLNQLTELASSGKFRNTDWAADFAYDPSKANATVEQPVSKIAAVAEVTPEPPVSNIAAVQVVAENPNLKSTVEDTRLQQYPTGHFTINETKVMLAKAGTSMLALASSNKVSLGELLSFNDMHRKDILEQDQLIYLERKKKKGFREFHEVLPGETMWTISQAEGIRLDQIVFWNNIPTDKPLAPGTKIYLQAPAPTDKAIIR